MCFEQSIQVIKNDDFDFKIFPTKMDYMYEYFSLI